MENKKIFYLVIILLAIIGIILLLYLEKYSIKQEMKNEDLILSELEKLNIQVTGKPNSMETSLPVSLSGPNWGLKKITCEEGGYDLSLFAGKTVLLTSYPINEKYQNEPLDVWIISSNDKIVCVYKAVQEGSQLAPGIFPVKEKNTISNFEECSKFYPVLESYPRQCKTPDGRNFVEGVETSCKNLCGDGICDEVVCQAFGCPCAETPENCPQDCAKK